MFLGTDLQRVLLCNGRAKGDPCAMKKPMRWWTVWQYCSTVQGMCKKMNILLSLSLLPSLSYINNTALAVLEQGQLCRHIIKYVQRGKENHSVFKDKFLTFSSNLEYLSCSDLNISCGGIFIFASFAACNTKHALAALESQIITDNLSF